MSDSNKPASASSDTAADKNKPQADASLEAKDENPTLKLVTRVLDTFRAPLPSQQVLLIPQRHRALPGCPLCDASVYSYCDYKVYHDGCCCGTMNGGYGHGFSGVSNGLLKLRYSREFLINKINIYRNRLRWMWIPGGLQFSVRKFVLRASTNSELLLQFSLLAES